MTDTKGSRAESEKLPAADDILVSSADPTPEVVPPNQTVPEGQVEVETPEKNVRRKANAPAAKPKKDPLKEAVEHDKLPVSVSVGDVVLQVASRFGNPVASLSLRGWVGEPEFQIPVDQVVDVEKAIAELRKVLG